MKKIIIALAAVLAAFSASAQVGIVGGITSAETKVKNVDVKAATQYHIGVAYKMPLAMGFVFQPELLYNVKGSKLGDIAGVSLDNFNTKTGFLELGAQVQWGMDLAVARPYLLAEPFLGYALNGTVGDEKISSDGWKGINRLEYGIALGVGVEVIKHVQVSAKYFWNVGKLYTEDGSIQSGIIKNVTNALKDGTPGGVQISAAIFF